MLDLPRGLVKIPAERLKDRKEALRREYKLTSREIQIVVRSMSPDSYNVIAKELGISVRTLKFHFYQIYKKIGLTSRIDLIFFMSDYLR